MNVKLDILKPTIGVENTEILHPLFFTQFLRYYEVLKQNKTNFPALVLTGLFLHLTMESYITWTIRWLLKNINIRKNRRLTKLWENHFEDSANLNKKVQFFADSFLTDTDISEVKKIKKFVSKLGSLRNRIVHGHEFSVVRWSNGREERTKLAELLTFKKISDNYKNFKDCMNIMSTLLKKVDMEDITSGIPSKKWIVDYLTFKF